VSATHVEQEVRAPAGIPRGWQGGIGPGRRYLATAVTDFSRLLRWGLVLIALAGYVAGLQPSRSLLLAATIVVFNSALYLLDWRRHPLPVPFIALADCLFISLVVALRGAPGSESYLLYALPIFYLGLHYAWRGAVAACILAGLSYGLTLVLSSQVPALTWDVNFGYKLLGRAAYFLFATTVVSVIVREHERNQRTLGQLHTRAREQVRRLEAIQRITQQLNTMPTSQDVARLIVAETQGVIPFENCRVHMCEETPEGTWLPLVAFYGQLSNQGALQAGAVRLRLGEGITGWVAAQGQPLLVADATQDTRAQHIAGTPLAPNSMLAVPLMHNTQVKGVIVLSQPGPAAFSEDDLQLMVTLANAAAIALDNIESRESLARQATIDAITGLAHHGAFQAALAQARDRAVAREEALGLALLDIDGFHSYNERMGLAAGDDALRQTGRCLEQVCQAANARVGAPSAAPAASCFRIGGDEFAVLLSGPLSVIDLAMTVVQECLQAVGAGTTDDAMLRVTLSAGLAFFPVDATTRRELLDTAEAALYLVKQTGGNRLGLADAAAKETLRLRHMLEEMVHASLEESGSPAAVQHLVAEAASLSQRSRHASLAQQLTTEALRALAAAIDAKDDYTRGHSERVAATAGEIARWLDLPAALIEHLTTAARMHDIGKIGVPDHVLHKRGPLTPLEQAVVATHPDIGADILAPIHTLQDVVPIVRHHHEHYDGQGYPEGLAGTAIPLGARVVAVADAIDAMITDRPYRRGMQITPALAELQKWAGSHYDPQVVAAALALYGPGGAGLALRGVLTTHSPSPDGPAPPIPTTPDLDLMMHPEPVFVPRPFPLMHARRRARAGRPADAPE